LNQFKSHLIQETINTLKKASWKNISASECEEFFVLVKLVNENSSSLNEDMKQQYVELLEKLIKNIVSLMKSVFKQLFA
jgi:phosphoenolpyruvate carboxylase